MRLKPFLRDGVRTWLLLLNNHSRSYVGNSRMESKPGRTDPRSKWVAMEC